MSQRFRFLLFPGIAVFGALFLSFYSVAMWTPSYDVKQSIRNPQLDANHCRFELQFPESLFKGGEPIIIEYSCNGVIERFILDSTLSRTVTVSPGSYKFQVFTEGASEITTDSIQIAGGYHTSVAFHLIIPTVVPSKYPGGAVTFKPVLYVYAKGDQEVNLQLQPKGRFTFTYPDYEKGWKGTAHADGSMTINGKNYPYLFWEGLTPGLDALMDYSSGFLVKHEEVIAFLEEKLSTMGLNEKEQTDFITFWGPRMAASETNFVRFLFNENYNSNIASLHVSPTPKSIFRVYLLWTPLDGQAIEQPIPQVIPTMNRTEFHVLEWGGSEIPFNKSL